MKFVDILVEKQISWKILRFLINEYPSQLNFKKNVFSQQIFISIKIENYFICIFSLNLELRYQIIWTNKSLISVNFSIPENFLKC